MIIYTVLILWLLTTLQGVWSLIGGIRFYRYVRRMMRRADELRDEHGVFKYQPRAAVILPCCGVDEELMLTVQALAQQNYADYEVIFTFESEDDSAYAAVERWTRQWVAPRTKRVVAGLTTRRSQKVHNLLAAVGAVSDDREVIVFLDSDAVPGQNWIGYLIAPLCDPSVGAATGYRWYSAAGGVASGFRCAWNGATVTLLDDDQLNFCWGGATAIRRETFEAIDIPGHWDRALSDDYQMTRAIRKAGLHIKFVPQALIPSADETTLRAFWRFAVRQLIITRVCAPHVWAAGLILCSNFMLGGSLIVLLFAAAALGWIGDARLALFSFVGWMLVLLLASGKAFFRQLAIRQALRYPAVSWRDFCWDVFGIIFSGMLHLSLFVASTRSRRIVWRNTIYELVSPDETRVIGRLDDRESVPVGPTPAMQKAS